jgi:hypothetical protein
MQGRNLPMLPVMLQRGNRRAGAAPARVVRNKAAERRRGADRKA